MPSLAEDGSTSELVSLLSVLIDHEKAVVLANAVCGGADEAKKITVSRVTVTSVAADSSTTSCSVLW